MVGGSQKHFNAAKNAFNMVAAQSFATGGWGPDETLRAPDSDDVFASLTNSHASFETPCGSYAHFKITRYLLRTTRDSTYGDSMERVMYNTILGAKPLGSDGSTYYYSDYNFGGKKVYSKNRWACCSGTHPQVAADYRINTYFRDPRGLYVNLYIPSAVRWVQDGARVAVTQAGAYPFADLVTLNVETSHPATFTINLRIPAWANDATISVNGKRASATPGAFAELTREWKSGDQIELELPLKTRLEAISPRHPETVALLQGPLVLFPVTAAAPQFTRAQLLAAKQSGELWHADSAAGPIKLLPFTAIADEPYTTYVRVT
jgi:uncharacterized protein